MVQNIEPSISIYIFFDGRFNIFFIEKKILLNHYIFLDASKKIIGLRRNFPILKTIKKIKNNLKFLENGNFWKFFFL